MTLTNANQVQYEKQQQHQQQHQQQQQSQGLIPLQKFLNQFINSEF